MLYKTKSKVVFRHGGEIVSETIEANLTAAFITALAGTGDESEIRELTITRIPLKENLDNDNDNV